MTAIDREFKRQQFQALKAAADNGQLVPPKRKGFTPKTRRAVYERQQGICAACGEWIHGWKFEVDHVLERDLMGSNELSNLEALHPSCHKAKTSARAGVLAKVHRLADETFSPLDETPSRLQSRGFDKSIRKKMDGSVVRSPSSADQTVSRDPGCNRND